MLSRSCQLLNVSIDEDGLREIARRSRGTPRIANRLLRRVRDYALVNNISSISGKTADAALEIYEVDHLGLDRLDRAVLSAIIDKFGGGPVGVSTLAISVGEEVETVEAVSEPFLLRLGLITRTPRGRVATSGGYRHLGLEPPTDAGLVLDLP